MSQGLYLPHDPINLILCADLSAQVFENTIDAVWQLLLNNNGPLSLTTSFGLRAQSFQLYPVFMVNKVGYRNISEFFSPPKILKLWPDHIQLSLNPNPQCSATFDLWVSAPDNLNGRIILKNTDRAPHELGARVASQLMSFGKNNGMSLTKRKAQHYLKGESDDIQIAVIMDGMVKPTISPELALENTKLLSPGESLNIFWRCKVSEGSKPEDDRTFSIFPVNWDAEMARLELNQHTREINFITPNVDWDIALRMTQHQAQQHLIRSDEDSEKLELIATRNPHSRRNNSLINNSLATDHSQLNALTIWQIVHTMLPARTQDCVRLFISYLNALPKPTEQNNKTEPDFPILCQTAWTIHSYLDDKSFLETVYTPLRSRLFSWFWRQNDVDQDGLPEWSSLAQSMLKDLASFDPFNTDAPITSISSIESVGLAALLMKECRTLNLMARVMEDLQTQRVLDTLISKLNLRIKEFREQNMLNRDRDSHSSHSQETYFEGQAKDLENKTLKISTPSRINIKIKPDIQILKPSGLSLQGLDARGQSIHETIATEDIQWLPGVFLYTSKAVFSRINSISGITDPNTQISLYRADLTQADISHLIAWDPNLDFPALQALMEQWVGTDEPNQAFGLPNQLPLPKPQSISGTTHIAWNGLLIQNVLLMGEQQLAFRLFEQLVGGTIVSLKQEHALHEGFSSASGQPVGKANSITGILPLTLFLDILGIKIFSPTKVSIGGNNPVPWPVTVRYMGMEITRNQKNSTIIMPNGSIYHHFGSATKTFVMQESES